ncbi:MAG: conjugative transfer signal peptidase TraF [Candidatus Binatus sp.]
MVRAECKAMCVRVRDGVGSMIGLLRSGAGGRRALSGAFGVVKEWGKGRSFVEQDKASAVQCRRSSVFSNILTPFPPLESILVGQLYSAAKIALERVSSRLHFECFRQARRPVLAMLGPVIAVALLVALGSVFGLRISLTDSAAPAGIYRLVGGLSIKHGELVGACLPASIAQEGIARGYLQQGDCPSGAEPVAKIVGALPGDLVEVKPGWVSVDGQMFANSAAAAHDSIGRPLPHVPWGRHQVAPGEVWLFGFHNVRSWDARYFGSVPLSEVRAALKPVLTW